MLTTQETSVSFGGLGHGQGGDIISALRIIGFVILLFSILPLGIAVCWYDRTESFLENAVKTRAIVVDMKEHRSDGDPLYYPVFSFTDREDNRHEIRSSIGANPSPYAIGDRVEVYYDPDHPQHNKLDRFVSLWLGPVLPAAIGLILVVIGGLVYLAGPAIVRSVYGDPHAQAPVFEPARHPTGAASDAVAKEREQERMWAMLTHMTALCLLAGIPFGNILAPLFIWIWKRRASPFVDANGKESLNFQISMTLYGIVSLIFCFLLIGFFLLVVLAVADLVLVVMASLQADKGAIYRYPFTLRFIR
jgi:hypothetical protein